MSTNTISPAVVAVVLSTLVDGGLSPKQLMKQRGCKEAKLASLALDPSNTLGLDEGTAWMVKAEAEAAGWTPAYAVEEVGMQAVEAPLPVHSGSTVAEEVFPAYAVSEDYVVTPEARTTALRHLRGASIASARRLAAENGTGAAGLFRDMFRDPKDWGLTPELVEQLHAELVELDPHCFATAAAPAVEVVVAALPAGDPLYEEVLKRMVRVDNTQEEWKKTLAMAQMFAPNRAGKIAAMQGLFDALDDEGIPHSRYYILAGMIRSAAWRFLSPIAWIGVGKKDRISPMLDAAGDLWALLLVWEADVAAGVRGYSDADADEFLEGGVVDTTQPSARGVEPGTPVPLFPEIWELVRAGREKWVEDRKAQDAAVKAAVWGNFFSQK